MGSRQDAGYRLGPLLRSVRSGSGRSQVDLTDALGASAARLCALERGRQVGPSQDYVARLANALDATRDQAILLARAAARDGVLLEAKRREFSSAEMDFLAACLDATVLLSPQDLEVIGKSISKQVATRMSLMRMGGQPTFIEPGRGD
jgi:transcriptional regulator with XRE-family HTH domain